MLKSHILTIRVLYYSFKKTCYTNTEMTVLQAITVLNSISFRKSSAPMTHIIHLQ